MRTALATRRGMIEALGFALTAAIVEALEIALDIGGIYRYERAVGAGISCSLAVLIVARISGAKLSARDMAGAWVAAILLLAVPVLLAVPDGVAYAVVLSAVGLGLLVAASRL